MLKKSKSSEISKDFHILKEMLIIVMRCDPEWQNFTGSDARSHISSQTFHPRTLKLIRSLKRSQDLVRFVVLVSIYAI